MRLVVFFVVIQLNELSKGDTTGFNYLNYLSHSVQPCKDFYGFVCGQNYKKLYANTETRVDELEDFRHKLEDQIEELLRDNQPQNEMSSILLKARAFYYTCKRNFDKRRSVMPEMRLLPQYGFPMLNYEPPEPITWMSIAKLEADYALPFLFHYGVSLRSGRNIIEIRALGQGKGEHGLNLRGQPSRSQNRIVPNEPSPYDLIEYLIEKFLRRKHPCGRINKGVIRTHMSAVRKFISEMESHDQTGYIDLLFYNFHNSTIESLQYWTSTFLGPTTDLDWLKYLKKIFRHTGITLTYSTPISIFDLYRFAHVIQIVEHYLKHTPNAVLNALMLNVMLRMLGDSDLGAKDTVTRYLKQFPRFQDSAIPTISQMCVRKLLDYDGMLGFGTVLLQILPSVNVPCLRILGGQVVKRVKDIFAYWIQSTDPHLGSRERQLAQNMILNAHVEYGLPYLLETHQKANQLFQALVLTNDDHYENCRRYRVFKHMLTMLQLKQPSTKYIWKIPPLSYFTNYDFGRNIIAVSMAALLWGLESPIPLKQYSKFGHLVGYALAQRFLQRGPYGTTISWSENYTDSMETYITCLDQHYNGLVANAYTGALTVDPRATLASNFGDNVGLKAAYEAFRGAGFGEMNNVPDSEYTLQQHFFISYAAAYCTKSPTQQYDSTIAPARYRVNVPLANMREFMMAFQCPTGSPMNMVAPCRFLSFD